MKNISDQVHHAIDECGLSRYAISKRSGVSEGMLSRFMSGQTSMSLRTLDRIAPIVGLTIDFKRPKKKKD